MKTVTLSVSVEVPEGIEAEALAGYLDRFIDIGLSDLSDTVNDTCLESTEEDEVVASSTKWGSVTVTGG